ncbi:MAG: hypothetical protein AAB677_03050 [Patescibacteria group bacterium]
MSSERKREKQNRENRKFDSRLVQMFGEKDLRGLTEVELALVEIYYGIRDGGQNRTIPPAGSAERVELWNGIRDKLMKGRGSDIG